MKRAPHIYGRPGDAVSFPTALLSSGLSPSEIYVYVLLLDRAASAAGTAQADLEDPEEAPFICFPIQELAEALGRGTACIKSALRNLEKTGLITRRLQGGGLPCRIWVKPFGGAGTSAEAAARADVIGKR